MMFLNRCKHTISLIWTKPGVSHLSDISHIIVLDYTHNYRMWQTASDFFNTINITSIKEGWDSTAGMAEYHAPYNNFHASRFDLWKSKELGDLFEYMEDTECGFFQYAWGDANFHAVVLKYLVEVPQAHSYEFIHVQHNWFYMHILGIDTDEWADEPKEDI